MALADVASAVALEVPTEIETSQRSKTTMQIKCDSMPSRPKLIERQGRNRERSAFLLSMNTNKGSPSPKLTLKSMQRTVITSSPSALSEMVQPVQATHIIDLAHILLPDRVPGLPAVMLKHPQAHEQLTITTTVPARTPIPLVDK